MNTKHRVVLNALAAEPGTQLHVPNVGPVLSTGYRRCCGRTSVVWSMSRVPYELEYGAHGVCAPVGW